MRNASLRATRFVQQTVVAMAALITVAVMAGSPVVAAQSAKSAAASRQVCTGYASNQKCDNVDVTSAQDALTSYLHGIGRQGSGAGTQQIGQQVQTIIQQLNNGNLPAPGNGNVPPSVDQQTIEAELQALQAKAQQYLDQAGAGPGSPTPTPSPQPTPAPSPNPGSHPTPTPPNPTPGSGNPAQVCQNLQDSLNRKIDALNASAQDALARLDAALVKLQTYQSTAGTPVDQQLLDAVQQAQTAATQAVATLSALSVTVDCSQPASQIAAALSTVKASADSTKAKLQDFQKSLTQLINTLATQAKP